MIYITKLSNLKLNPISGTQIINVTSPFGNRRFYNSKTKKYESGFHNGIDLTGGDDIVSIINGTVTKVRKNVKGYSEKYSSGNYVEITNKNIKTTYCHLKEDSITVKTGDKIKIGDFVGKMGKTGHATGKHLHLGIKVDNNWVDPKPYLLGKKSLETNITNNELYIIKKGDTLTSIAFKYNVDIDEIVKSNNIKDKNKIYTGDLLKIPVKSEITYIVKSGDNLTSIAKRYNTSWRKIYNDNKDIIGDNPNLIKKGMKLNIKL